MKSEFNSEFFRGNRNRLRSLFTGKAPIIITANSLIQSSTSMTYPFTQDGNFWYLTGIDVPNMILVMDKNKEYFILPELSHYQKVFDGTLTPVEITEKSGVEDILSNRDGWRQLELRLKKVKHIATLAAPPKFVATYGMNTNPARATLIESIKILNDQIVPLDLSSHLQRMRMIKQPIEVLAIKRAIDATITGLKFVEKKYLTAKYKHEFDVVLDLNKLYWSKGASKHSFEPIVASGERGLTMHVSDKMEMDPNKQLLIDVGAEFDHYAADISRTWMRNPSKRFLEVKNTVSDVADYAISLLKPGVILRDYEKKIEIYMGEKLRELGLIQTIETGNVRKYFPHATSHFLGIDTHDVGDYSVPIDENVVLTVEPGIYIPNEGIGVRIEDDIIITKDGCKNLSSTLVR